jgi:hypothetical protein
MRLRTGMGRVHRYSPAALECVSPKRKGVTTARGRSEGALGEAEFLADRAMETRREFRTNKVVILARAWYHAFALNTSVVLCGPSS